jgi:2-dehydropantoate 2-reductase
VDRRIKADLFRGRIGVIGAGALGCFYGARLLRAGHDVHFLMRRDYAVVRRRGLTVHSIDGDFTVRPPVYPSAEALGRCDLVLIGLKTTDNAALPALLAPTAGPTTLALTLQNGLGNEEAIEQVLATTGQSGSAGRSDVSLRPSDAADRILGGTAFLCSHRGEPGVVHHTDHGWVQLAEVRGPARPRTHAIAELFRSAGIRCEVLDSLAEIRWRKLVWNIPFNGLGVAAGGADAAAILADPMLAAVARGLREEVIAAARSDGVTVEREMIDTMMAATATMGAYKSSMQIDWENGRPLESEAILGEPLRRAHRAGIAVPRMEMLYALIRRLARMA